jgi:acyl carrier protein
MTRDKVEEIVTSVLREIMEAQSIAAPADGMAADMPLIGSLSVLDSMAFVMLTAGIEQQLSEQLDIAVTIVNEKAMSMRNSPFRTVGTLTDYVFALTQEASASTQKA